MVLFQKGLEIKDEQAALIGDQLYIEHELINYLTARAKAGLLQVREVEAKEEVKEFVKEGDIKEADAIKAEGEIKP